MAEYTRPATWDDLKLVARHLNEAEVEYALIGGYAIAAHGYNRFSEDLDILVNPSKENARRWISALAKLPDGATKELLGQEDLFEREGPYAVRVNDEFTVDVMPSACGHPWDELKPYEIHHRRRGRSNRDRAERRSVEAPLSIRSTRRLPSDAPVGHSFDGRELVRALGVPSRSRLRVFDDARPFILKLEPKR
jgi:hypothetical protein